MLTNRLIKIRRMRSRDSSLSFYRHLLLPLFHQGLGSVQSTPSVARLLGRIPYLDGSLFEVHQLEEPSRYGQSIQIRDEAFQSLFDFFDNYHWHLDDRPHRADNEINPDVLGYIFEKYINQKELGAYYTQEDITGYICANTILATILDLATSSRPVEGIPNSESNLFQILRKDPDRYIHASMRHGTKWDDTEWGEVRDTVLDRRDELPRNIAQGLAPHTAHLGVSKSNSLDTIQTLRYRSEWNADAHAKYGHRSESWRGVVDRHRRCEGIRQKLMDSGVNCVDDMVTLNLDLRQFLQDLVETCYDPNLLWSFWSAITRVTILDPTCGSGAFLLAALSLLEPIYESCLDRMEFLLAESDGSGRLRNATVNPPPPHPVQPISTEISELFRDIISQTDSHPSRRYFILKTIVLHNLYGVDIMAEAVEICKLRLFLKLASQLEPDYEDANLGIEPLPDVDFNIRVGNAIVGFS